MNDLFTFKGTKDVSIFHLYFDRESINYISSAQTDMVQEEEKLFKFVVDMILVMRAASSGLKLSIYFFQLLYEDVGW